MTAPDADSGQAARLPNNLRPRKGTGAFDRAAAAAEAVQRVLSQSNDEAQLVEQVCHAFVRSGRYAAAWIVFNEPGDSRSPQPKAWAGIAPDGATAFASLWADLPWNKAGAAIEADRVGPVVIQGIHETNNPDLTELKAHAHEHGYDSACALPLLLPEGVPGALVLLDTDSHAFPPTTARLLSQLANHLAFAIHASRQRETAERAAQRLRLVDRALRTLSAGNRALLRCVEEAQLLSEMCHCIVHVGGYRLAWVGYAQHDEGRSILPMAQVGYDLDKLDSFHFTWADTPQGQSPPAVAIRTGQPSVRREFASDPILLPFREQAEREGYASISAFPLVIDGEVIGNLDIAAAEADAFGDDELAVLAELAADMSFGIANLRMRARHRQAERTIERMAFYDALTGLPNLARLRERLSHAIDLARAQRRPLALLTLNVDRFREINEVLGFQQGDALVGELAERLKRRIESPAMLARLGVDQFGVLLPGAGAERAEATARDLAHILDEPFSLAGTRVEAQASIGIALFPGHGTDAELLILRSDAAMYQAKRNRTGIAIFRGDGEPEIRERLSLVTDLRCAIEEDQLRLYVQPKVNIPSGALCGAEALVRWQHPQRGLIQPDRFIPLAERVGLINPLTYWVTNAALSQCYSWRDAGFSIPLAINLSARNLLDPRLLDRLNGLLTTWGASPEWLQLELTESALMEDPQGALEILRQLNKLGFQLVVDDFGTGYSSLSYLQRLPLVAVKIDKSFVMAMPNDHDSGVIVRSTIDMVHNIGLKVVAEGTENQFIWRQLADLGADVAQGTFISDPMPSDDFHAWSVKGPWASSLVH